MTLSFPPLPFGTTVRDTFVAVAIHLKAIVAIAALPYVLSLAIFVAEDLYLAASYTGVQATTVHSVAAFITQFLIFSFFAVNVHRLMLVGDSAGEGRMDEAALDRYWIYIKRLLTIAVVSLPLWGVVFLLSLGLAPWFDVWLQLVLTLVAVLLAFILLSRFTFVLSASGVDAPYSLMDSWRALAGVHLKVISIYFTVMLPALVILVGFAAYLNLYAPPIVLVGEEIKDYQLNLSYWVWAPVGLFLLFVMQALLVTAISICFYHRTGWRPGAERVDY
jgi:hypothetical protein